MPRTPMTDRAVATRAGYYIRQGAYQGTPDDRLGRWYVGRSDAPFRPYGPGYPTQRTAWAVAADLARELAAAEQEG